MSISRRSAAVMIAGAAAFFDLYSPQAVLPQLAADFGVSAHQAGWVIMVTTLAVALVGPFAGALADVFGRKRLITAGAMLMGIPVVLAGFATTFSELLVWRAIAGMLMPLIFCVTVAYIGEEWEAHEARSVTALYMAGAVAGGFLGRFFCGILTDAFGWRDAFIGLGAINLLIGLALLVLLPRERAFRAGAGLRSVLKAMLGHLRRADILAACLVGWCILFGQVALFTYISLRLAGHPYGLSPGLLASVSAVYLLGMVSTPILGSRLRRLRESVPLSTGVTLFVAGIGLTLFSPLWLVIAGMALASAGTFLSQSAATSFVASAAPTARSAAIGVYTTFYYVGGSIGAVAPGALWEKGGWPPVAWLLIATSVASMIVAIAFWRKRQAQPSPACDREATPACTTASAACPTPSPACAG